MGRLYRSVKKGESLASLDLANSYQETYFEEAKLMYSQYVNSTKFRLLDNAFRTGKACVEFTLYANDSENVIIFNYVARAAGAFEPLKIRDWLLGFLEQRKDAGDKHFTFSEGSGELTLRMEELPGVRTFSPFAKAVLNPLKAMPSDWKLSHVKRALANGQFAQLRCDGRYSDDYQYDAATNFGKGEIEHVDGFLKQLVERPDGWWTSLDRTSRRVNVGCHHFDSNSFLLSL